MIAWARRLKIKQDMNRVRFVWNNTLDTWWLKRVNVTPTYPASSQSVGRGRTGWVLTLHLRSWEIKFAKSLQTNIYIYINSGQHANLDHQIISIVDRIIPMTVISSAIFTISVLIACSQQQTNQAWCTTILYIMLVLLQLCRGTWNEMLLRSWCPTISNFIFYLKLL